MSEEAEPTTEILFTEDAEAGVESTEATEDKKEESLDLDDTDAEIEAIKKKMKEMEEEAAKIEALQSNVEIEHTAKPKPASGPAVDSRSIYVGNVDYSTTPEELQEFFQSCGTVNRITILCNKFTGQPKGFAYVEFKDAEAIVNAMILNDQEFKGRALKISPKRTNVPGYARGRGRGRGGFRGGRGRGGGGYGAGGYGHRRGGYRRRAAAYHPYY